MDLARLRNKTERYVIGLMSGTSCDGIDAVLVRVKGTGSDLAIKVIRSKTFPYTPVFRLRLLAPRMDAAEVCALNYELGKRFAEAAAEMQKAAHEEGIEPDFVASSGHTLAHFPPKKADIIGTLQVGEAAIIAEQCGLPVVSDFRQRDLAAGGQGAPLVAYADWVLFHRADKTVACLNLGGIANVTVVTPERENVLAFDVGPCNMAIDGAVRLLTRGQQDYDEGGKAALSGVVIDEFLEYLLDHPYFGKVPPKTTGREDFGPEVYLRDALNNRKGESFDDLIATVTASIPFAFIRAYTRFIKPQYKVERLVLSGGGVHNRALVKRLKQGLPDLVIRTSDQYGIDGDAREALAFAILGNETVCNTPANIPQATGAHHEVILGKITPP